MPMTIETEINNTIATFERNGADGLQKDSLISPRSAGVPFTPTTVVVKPGRHFNPPRAEFDQFFAEKGALSNEDEQFALNGLCLDKNTKSGLPQTKLIQMLIDIYEATRSTPKPTVNHVIDKAERLAIISQPDCGDAMNFFEKFTFANTTVQDVNGNNPSAGNLSAFIDLLNVSGPSAALLNTTKLGAPALRTKIALVRAELGQVDLVASATTQATPALVARLVKLQKEKAAATAAPTPNAASSPNPDPNAAPAAPAKQ